MSDIQQIVEICQDIASQGKQPSVALVKGRLSKPIALPNIIAGIKSWQNNPVQKVQVKEKTSDEQISSDSTMQELELRVSALELLVKNLQQQLDLLSGERSDS